MVNTTLANSLLRRLHNHTPYVQQNIQYLQQIRFNGLQLADREQELLWSDIRDIMNETADKGVPKVKREKVTKWLSDKAVKIANERRDVRSKGDDKEYSRLNAVFQNKV